VLMVLSRQGCGRIGRDSGFRVDSATVQNVVAYTIVSGDEAKTANSIRIWTRKATRSVN